MSYLPCNRMHFSSADNLTDCRRAMSGTSLILRCSLREMSSVMVEKKMDREHIKGAAKKAKGAIKETVGKSLEAKSCRLRESWTKQRARRIRLPAT
jgi:hypothetical protein